MYCYAKQASSLSVIYNLHATACKRNVFLWTFLLCNGAPCISRLNMYSHHILIILPANSMTTYSYKSYGYFIIYLYITVQFFSDRYSTTEPVWSFWLESKILWNLKFFLLLQQWFSTISPPYHLIRLCPHFKTPQRPENSSYLRLRMERCTL